MEASHLIRLLVLSSSNDYFVFVGMKGVNLLNVKHLNYPIIVTHFFFNIWRDFQNVTPERHQVIIILIFKKFVSDSFKSIY